MLVNIGLPGSLDKYDGLYEVDIEKSWIDFLKSVLHEDYDFLFDGEEQPKQFVAIYLNNKKLFNLSDLNCKDNDNLIIISATSGG